MKLACLFSGGKDSTLALVKAQELHEVVCLVSVFSKNPESYMFHVPNIHLTELQAMALDLPLIKQSTKGVKEEELEDLKQAFIKARDQYGIQGVVTGAIRSVYQASRVQRVCHELGLWCFNPLWLIDQVELLNETIERGFKTIISGVFAYPFTKDFLGKVIDEEVIVKLKSFEKKYSVNPAGEGGEIETTVLDAPFFKKRIDVIDASQTFENYSGVYFIKEAGLVNK